MNQDHTPPKETPAAAPPVAPLVAPPGDDSRAEAGEPSLFQRLREFIQENFSQRPLVSWLLVVAVVLVLWLRVAAPLIQWAADTRQQAATLARALAGLEAMAQREAKRLKTLEADQRALQELAASLPTLELGRAQDDLARQARKLAEASGLKVVGSLFLAPRNQGSLLRVALRLSAEGSYRQVLDFLRAFQKAPGLFLAPASFTLAPSPQAGGRLRLECEVVTLVRRRT